ncbi:hypothetical protein EYF80_033743 [Liparis tanakae]|uniref:Uncharacterized protein n=1 Tax=Liparis tanakae TaxID=230148 RepID=A0A4Z2GR31_9TELE|nr:hypothetical protein EYF80_033743 [Liparis tanakae]
MGWRLEEEEEEEEEILVRKRHTYSMLSDRCGDAETRRRGDEDRAMEDTLSFNLMTFGRL